MGINKLKNTSQRIGDLRYTCIYTHTYINMTNGLYLEYVRSAKI